MTEKLKSAIHSTVMSFLSMIVATLVLWIMVMLLIFLGVGVSVAFWAIFAISAISICIGVLDYLTYDK